MAASTSRIAAARRVGSGSAARRARDGRDVVSDRRRAQPSADGGAEPRMPDLVGDHGGEAIRPPDQRRHLAGGAGERPEDQGGTELLGRPHRPGGQRECELRGRKAGQVRLRELSESTAPSPPAASFSRARGPSTAPSAGRQEGGIDGTIRLAEEERLPDTDRAPGRPSRLRIPWPKRRSPPGGRRYRGRDWHCRTHRRRRRRSPERHLSRSTAECPSTRRSPRRHRPPESDHATAHAKPF